MIAHPPAVSAHQAILDVLYSGAPHPTEIILPEEMFRDFCADMDSTGHSYTVWDIPVRSGNVEDITLALPRTALPHQKPNHNITNIPKVIGAVGFGALWYSRWLWPSAGPVLDLFVVGIATLVIFFILDWIADQWLARNKQNV